MGAGAASIATNQKKEVATPGPPFPATSADNGLSVDGVSGRIVLGNDVGSTTAILLKARVIPMGGFRLQMLQGTDPVFSVDPGGAVYQLGDINGVGNGYRLVIDDNIGFATLGSDNGPGANMYISLDGGSQIARITGTNAGTTVPALRLDFFQGQYRMGDTEQVRGLTFFEVDDSNSLIRGLISNYVGLKLDFLNRMFVLGDADSVHNNTGVFVDDTNRDIALIAANSLNYDQTGVGSSRLFINTNIAQFGDIPGDINGAYIEVNYGAANGQILLMSGLANATSITVEDVTQRVLINSNGAITKLLLRNTEMQDDGTTFDITPIGNLMQVKGNLGTVAGFGNMISQAGNGTFFGSVLSNQGYVLGDISITPTQGIKLTPGNTDVTIDNAGHNVVVNINGTPGFTGTVTPVTSITVVGGIVTNVT